MMKNNIIQESTSPWQSPVVLCKKKSGDYRFAVDYRALNKLTEPESYPVPLLENIFDTISAADAKFFTTLDLASGFWQIPMDPLDRHKTSFATRKGKFEFLRMPFGLRNAPTTYQRMMCKVLQGLNWKILLVYMDDIIIFSSTFEEHLDHLKQVFERLQEANLTLKPGKCKFAAEKVLYLGHQISENGIEVNTDKTAVITSFPPPKTQKQVRTFLGMCNYYRKFISNYSQIAAPMYSLLKADATFKWTEICERAFNTLKEALKNPPVLAHPDMRKPFIVSTDASTSGIGYILSQKDTKGKEHPVVYGGRSLRKHEKNYGITELECLALVEAVRTFHIYLADNEFTAFTDHKALQSLHKIKPEQKRLHRWAELLLNYKIKVEYKPGTKMANADAISRREYPKPLNIDIPEEVDEQTVMATQPITAQAKTYHEITIEYGNDAPEVNFLTTSLKEGVPSISVVSEETISSDQKHDTEFKDIYAYLDNDQVPEDAQRAKRALYQAEEYCLDKGVLYHIYKPRSKGTPKHTNNIKQLAVPQKWRADILHAYHESLLGGGHQGFDRTLESIRLKYYWPKMASIIQEYVNSCDVCQKSKRSYNSSKAPLTNMPIDNRFERWHMDFIGPLKPPGTDGSRHILVMVDSFSRWCEAVPMKSQEASEVAFVLYSEIISRYGAPRKLVSDRGRNFLSKVVKALSELFNIKRHYTSSYHPQTNSTCERLNSYIQTQLKAYIAQNPSSWNRYIPGILMNYRRTPATQSTGYSPYYILFGTEMNCPIDTEYTLESTLPNSIQDFIKEIVRTHLESQPDIKENIKDSQSRNKKIYDKKTKIPAFKVGDRVLIDKKQFQPGESKKFQRPKQDNPHYIVENCDNFTYRLVNERTQKELGSRTNANRITKYRDPRDSLIPRPQENDLVVHQNQNREDIQNPNEQNQLRPIEKLLGVRKYSGKPWYRVQFRDTTLPREWMPVDRIPPTLLREYHIKYTHTGKRRKQRQKAVQ